MVIKVGDKLPQVTLFENDKDTQVELSDVFKGKKGILFAVPGAFTPGCSKTHLPGYVSDYDKLQAAGAEVIACTSTDNGYALAAWAKEHNAEGKIRMLADPEGKLAKALGVDATVPPLGLVSKRYSAVIKDNEVKAFNLEGDGFGTTCSLASATIGQLKEA
jgi:2-Cys peroxiredoxin 5